MGEFSRLTGVFFEPTKTFADIAERPRWLVPLVLLILASVVYMILFTQRVGWDGTIRQQMESNPRTAQMSPEQRERAITMGAKFASISAYAGPVVGIPVYDLIVAGVLLGIVAGLMSAPVKFKQVFAVVCYAGLPGVLVAALSIVVMFLKKPEDFNLRNPLAFNPGVFMDPQSSSKFLYSLATSLDLFVIWTILLIAVGLKAAAGKRLSFGGALFAVVLPWAAVILVKASLAGTGMFG